MPYHEIITSSDSEQKFLFSLSSSDYWMARKLHFYGWADNETRHARLVPLRISIIYDQIGNVGIFSPISHAAVSVLYERWRLCLIYGLPNANTNKMGWILLYRTYAMPYVYLLSSLFSIPLPNRIEVIHVPPLVFLLSKQPGRHTAYKGFFALIIAGNRFTLHWSRRNIIYCCMWRSEIDREAAGSKYCLWYVYGNSSRPSTFIREANRPANNIHLLAACLLCFAIRRLHFTHTHTHLREKTHNTILGYTKIYRPCFAFQWTAGQSCRGCV